MDCAPRLCWTPRRRGAEPPAPARPRLRDCCGYYPPGCPARTPPPPHSLAPRRGGRPNPHPDFTPTPPLTPTPPPPPPGAEAAEKLGLRVVRAARLDAETTTLIATHRPDLGVIVAYGGLVRDPLLTVPRHGWINLHFSLLPAWRGAAPVQHSLIAGGCGVGASVFRLVSQLDAGDLYASQPHAPADHETAGDVVDALARSGASLLSDVVTSIRAGTAHTAPQVGEPTFAPKLTLDDARLDWTHPAPTILARFRGVTPEPGAWTTVDGVRLKIRTLALDT